MRKLRLRQIDLLMLTQEMTTQGFSSDSRTLTRMAHGQQKLQREGSAMGSAHSFAGWIIADCTVLVQTVLCRNAKHGGGELPR
jgi:hypothetical protein